MPTTLDVFVGEDRTSEQPAIIRTAADAQAVRMAALFPPTVTDSLTDTLEPYKP